MPRSDPPLMPDMDCDWWRWTVDLWAEVVVTECPKPPPLLSDFLSNCGTNIPTVTILTHCYFIRVEDAGAAY